MQYLNKIFFYIMKTLSFIILAIFTYSELKEIYIPFPYVPIHWTQFIFQVVVVCSVSIIFSAVFIFAVTGHLKFETNLFMASSLLSCNTSFYCLIRQCVGAYSNNTYIPSIYYFIYFCPLLLALLICSLKENIRRNKIKCYITISLIVSYFFILTTKYPLFSFVSGSSLWLSMYIYYFNTFVFSLYALMEVFLFYRKAYFNIKFKALFKK